jgi:hypothetical protein
MMFRAFLFDIPIPNEGTGFRLRLSPLEEASSSPNRHLLFVDSETSPNEKMLCRNPIPFIGDGYILPIVAICCLIFGFFAMESIRWAEHVQNEVALIRNFHS